MEPPKQPEEVCYLPQPSAPARSVDIGSTDDILVSQDLTQADEQPLPPIDMPTIPAEEAPHQIESGVHQLEPKWEEKPSGLASHVSVGSLSQDFKNIDEALKSIESNLGEMECLEEEEEVVVVKEGGDEGTEDSESEGENEDGERVVCFN